MDQIEYLVEEIKSLPVELRTEVADYIGYIKKKYDINEKKIMIKDITLASEKELAKDWLNPKEDKAWQHL